MTTDEKGIHPFTGEEYAVADAHVSSTDDGLIYLVDHEGEKMYVVVYTDRQWNVQSSSQHEYIYTLDENEDTNELICTSSTTTVYKDDAFTAEKMYSPYGYEAPEVLYFTDAVVDVIELVGSAYSSSYNYGSINHGECQYLKLNRTLDEHRNFVVRTTDEDAVLAGTSEDENPLPKPAELRNTGYLPHSFRLYYDADIKESDFEETKLVLITEQESE